MKNVISALESAGAGLKDVIKCNVWLEDARDFASFNKVYLSYIGEHPPARSCVESRLMIAGTLEIEAIAYVGNRPRPITRLQFGAERGATLFVMSLLGHNPPRSG